MLILGGARAPNQVGRVIEIDLDDGFRLRVMMLDAHLARVLVVRPDGLRQRRTWSLSPEIGGTAAAATDAEPIDGRDRLDLSGFPGVDLTLRETADAIVLESELVRATLRRTPLAFTWEARATTALPFETVLEDRRTDAYRFNRQGPGFAHLLARDRAERYYGFGEKSGSADKHGRRLRMGTTDALGYDAETSDPLYKHTPFYITTRPDRGGASVGLFYDNLSHGTFDLGQTIDAYHGRFRSFSAVDGDLDFYVVFGPAIADVTARFTALTGRTVFPPRWTLSYSGSTMQYTDAPDAADKLGGFLDLLVRHDVPCQSFHMSSGYTLIGDRRFVFTWNRDRFPDPKAVSAKFEAAGVHLIANIKPALLTDHPRFGEVEAFRGFVRDSADPAKPHITQFWGGPAAYLDFTNPATSDWWTRNVEAEILSNGITATWNDNNEFEIWDDEAGVQGNGAGGRIACVRPVQTHLMLRASMIAQRRHAPGRRPHLISRSGGPGLQRYAQTWTGDNRTEWKTLRWNIRMGHGLSLSGLFNFGHDVGGFEGPKPDAELLMRWIEQGIYWPRFCIHSWNDDGSATEPWTHPEILPTVQAAFRWRERLVPLLYTLAWRAHAHHEPILGPLFLDFPHRARSYDEEDCFLLGHDLLVAPVLEQGATTRTAWLPEVAGGWFDLRDGSAQESGSVTVDAPLGAAPVFVRAGTILPLGPSPSWASGPLTLRLFPREAGHSIGELYDDDGDAVVSPDAPPCRLVIRVAWDGATSPPVVLMERQGLAAPRWSAVRFEDRFGQPLEVIVEGRRVTEIDLAGLPSRAGTTSAS